MYIFLSIFCFLVFLFTLYALSRDDVYFIKKGVTIEEVYNVAFLVIMVGLFFARLGFVVIYFQPLYLNPLAFLAIPYYPGLSLASGIIGSYLWARMYLASKKLPAERITDFLSISALSSLCFGYVMHAVIQTVVAKKILPDIIFQGASFIFLFFIIFFFFLPRERSGRLKDGTLTSIFFIGVSSVYFLYDSLFIPDDMFFFLGKEGIVAAVLFVFSVVFTIWKEKVFYRIRQLFKRRTM